MQTNEDKQLSYFDERMQLLGITPDINRIDLWHGSADVKADNFLKPVPIFRATDKGIDILVYRLNRHKVPYAKEGSRWKNNEYCITRLAEPITKPNGDILKYLMPKGQPTLPFFPPPLVDKFDKKEQIPVLYITEGYFKAFKACMHGIMCVGLPSITCMKDRETGELYKEIKDLITTCNVQRLVWLTDGDCRDITTKQLEDGVDIYKRPHGFFLTVLQFYDLTSKLDLQCYFAHINTENIEGHPKGLDDLLCQFQGDLFEIETIKQEFASFDAILHGIYPGKYLVKMQVSNGPGKVQRYFMLENVDVFYLHHVERRPELRNIKFKFSGTLYKYDDVDCKCKVEIPKDAGKYFRMGDTYYEHINMPDKDGGTIRTYRKRDKATIRDDFGKDIFQHIPKYIDQCNVPNHLNYQRVINGFFNVYHPFDHEPEEGDITYTLEFMKHIFGEETVSYTNKEGKEITVPRYELGIDYVQLLYQKPQHILPILCLVSRENSTGKTTFVNWLKKIFTENVAIVGNADFQSDFNAHWTSRLVIACDETKIDKHAVVEKLKSLSTATEVMINGKGQSQFSQQFFGKFILLSNNEDNFITVNDDDIRYWVIKVPQIKKKDLDLIKYLEEEIPAFLHFLNSRQMATDRKERHWFDTKLLHTSALDKLRMNSKPSIQKFLRAQLEEIFAATELREITMPLKAIAHELLKKPADIEYIGRTLREMGYRVGEPVRGSYPRMTEVVDGDGHISIEYKPVKFLGRAYTFSRYDFLGDTAALTVAEKEAASTTELPF